MEIRKVAIACFIGGALFCAVALMVAPVYKWFALIAGMAGGYISHEFREVRKAIPIALRAAGRETVYAWDSTIADVKAWLSRPHHFCYPAMIVVVPFYIWHARYHLVPLPHPIVFLPTLAAMFAEFIFLVWLAMVSLLTFAFIGARVGERCFWRPFVMIEDWEDEAHALVLNRKGYREKPLTYLSVLRWAVVGIAVTLRFFAWAFFKYLAIAVWATVCFLGRFAWHLFKLIHSEKRVLCAIDGTIGGVVSCIWFASSAVSFLEKAMLILFGGLLGAAFGVAESKIWEFVSKRILHVVHPS